jgi:capsular polysaccharide biosynthesis protein
VFSRADVVIAQHGAGLVNILFGKPGTLVLELCPRLHVMVSCDFINILYMHEFIYINSLYVGCVQF